MSVSGECSSIHAELWVIYFYAWIYFTLITTFKTLWLWIGIVVAEIKTVSFEFVFILKVDFNDGFFSVPFNYRCLLSCSSFKGKTNIKFDKSRSVD